MQIWYYNVPHTKLAEVKGHQNWVKVDGDHLTFPGGGTQFIHGALHYIDFIQQVIFIILSHAYLIIFSLYFRVSFVVCGLLRPKYVRPVDTVVVLNLKHFFKKLIILQLLTYKYM